MGELSDLLGEYFAGVHLRPEPVQTPEERAKSTLLSFLSPDQVATFTDQGYFEVKGADGQTYQVHTTESARKRTIMRDAYYRTTRAHHAHNYRLHRVSGPYGKVAWPVYAYGEKADAYNTYEEYAQYRWAVGGIPRHRIPELDVLLALKLTLEADPRRATVGCSIDIL